ncbi:unnamed protein product [Lactuca saligna]|uniref:Uncharacterized protein n=1 Tax=Lactuca saligna TaxID=75948 RepID=A0AA35YN97_LACSI|nr:unnamed protein product [Lactuca saligna]
MLSKDEQKYEPIISHMRRMMICYIHEVAKMDVEIASMLKKRPVVKLGEEPMDFPKRKLGKIRKEDWSVMYQRKEGEKVQQILFFLLDKHLYYTAALNNIMGLTVACKTNDDANLKGFNGMIKWYLVIKNTLLNLMTKLFKVQKKQQ